MIKIVIDGEEIVVPPEREMRLKAFCKKNRKPVRDWILWLIECGSGEETIVVPLRPRR